MSWLFCMASCYYVWSVFALSQIYLVLVSITDFVGEFRVYLYGVRSSSGTLIDTMRGLCAIGTEVPRVAASRTWK